MVKGFLSQSLVKCLSEMNAKDRERHTKIIELRNRAADKALVAAKNLIAAQVLSGNDGLKVKADELIRLARELRDYDPTSD